MAERGKFGVRTPQGMDIQAPGVNLAPVSRTVSPIQAFTEQIIPAVRNLAIPEATEQGTGTLRAVELWETLAGTATEELEESLAGDRPFSMATYEQIRGQLRSQALQGAREYGFSKEELTELQQLMTSDFGAEGRFRRSRVQQDTIAGIGRVVKLDGEILTQGIQLDPREIATASMVKVTETYGSAVLPILNRFSTGQATEDDKATLMGMYNKVAELDGIVAQNAQLEAMIKGDENERTIMEINAEKMLPKVRQNLRQTVGAGLQGLMKDRRLQDMTPDQIKVITTDLINNHLHSDTMTAYGEALGPEKWEAAANIMKQQMEQEANTLISANDTLKNLEYDSAVKEKTLNLIVQSIDEGLATVSPEAYHSFRNAANINNIAQAISTNALTQLEPDSVPGVLLWMVNNQETVRNDEMRLKLLSASRGSEALEDEVFNSLDIIEEKFKNSFPSSTSNPATDTLRPKSSLEFLYKFMKNSGFQEYIKDQSIEPDIRSELVNKLLRMEQDLINRSNIRRSQVEALQDEYKFGEGTREALRAAVTTQD